MQLKYSFNVKLADSGGFYIIRNSSIYRSVKY